MIPDALFIDSPPTPPSSSAVTLAPTASSAPQVVEIYPSTLSTPRGRPTSATDSGYARSNNGKTSDEDVELEVDARSFGDENDTEEEDEMEETERRAANRRARALTESPLAEVRFPLLSSYSSPCSYLSPL
jgi:hypothetical protein